jgi:deoxyribodipyrimidine photo-lyase
MPTSHPDDDGSVADATDTDHRGVVVPSPSTIPTPAAVVGDEAATGYVVWHRKHLRTDDHLALSEAIADGDVVCPLFVFDPTFYDDGGLACDTRIRFLHEAATSLDRLYAATSGEGVQPAERESVARNATETPLNRSQSDTGSAGDGAALAPPETRGLTFGYGDPVALLEAFADRGWSVLTMATPTSRYGKRRDERVREACGDAVTFVSGDGLVRDAAWPRKNWQGRVENWLTATQHAPGWDTSDVVRLTLDTGVTPASVDEAFETTPTKRKVPTGTHQAGTTQLREFVDRIESYPGNISAPQDARDGTSGLSPYINFGLLSVRQAYQYTMDNAPACRGREMFTSRLVWNMHYNQKLVDWPGWTDRAVNPVFEGRNEETHDPALVTAWKQGETGFPMVDASMRCLRETGWLNFRMRAMCASFFTHILQQPWWIGADWYHHHLIDSDVGINYTQWQSQAGLIGKPSQRVYNPRKQVRDHDPDGEWVTEWVPELAPLPSQFLDRPERTPLAVQQECGVVIGEDYPRPVVDFDSRREAFWSAYEQRRPEAARALGRPEVAKRASFSGGYDAARAIAKKYGQDEDDSRQVSLADVNGNGNETVERSGSDTAYSDGPIPAPTTDKEGTIPTGAGSTAGAPSPDDEAVAGTGGGDDDKDAGDGADLRKGDRTDTETEQTTMHQFG